MCEPLQISPGHQRLFHDHKNNYILLHKSGIAVCFWTDTEGGVHVSERLNNVNFKATGTQLRNEGWICMGPGMAHSRLLTEKS